jgi:hypothetical protein
MSENYRNRSGAYYPYKGLDGDIRKVNRLPQAEYLNPEKVLWKEKGIGPKDTLLLGPPHGDEMEVGILAQHVLKRYSFPRIEAWKVHELATLMGRREYIAPEESNYPGIVDAIPNDNNGRVARFVDLNRQFTVPEEILKTGSWEDIRAYIPYGPAKILLRLLQDNPHITSLFTFHEDTDHTDIAPPFYTPPPGKHMEGFYLYDTSLAGDTRYDGFIDGQMDILREALVRHRFSLFTGYDDEADSILRNWIDKSFTRQKLTKSDSTIEGFSMILSQYGFLPNLKHTFTLDFPSHQPKIRKIELVKLVVDNFLLPVASELKR